MQHTSTEMIYAIEGTHFSKFFSLLLNKKTFLLGAVFTATAGIAYFLLQKKNSPTENMAKTDPTDQNLEGEQDSTFFANDADVSDLSPLSLGLRTTAAPQPKSPLLGRHGTFHPSDASTASNCSEIPQSSRSNGSSYDVVDDADADYDPTKFSHLKSPLKPPAFQPAVQATVQPAPRKEAACCMM